MSKAPLVATIEEWLPAQTADTESDQAVGRAPYAGTVTKCSLVPEAAVTGDNTNSRTFTLVNKGQAGAGTAVLATLALTTGVDLVAFDEKLFTLASSPVVAEGDILAIAEVTPGTGVAHSGGKVEIRISRL